MFVYPPYVLIGEVAEVISIEPYASVSPSAAWTSTSIPFVTRTGYSTLFPSAGSPAEESADHVGRPALRT